jgi:hypothetical protein
MELFDEIMVRFRWTTKEKLEQAKRDAMAKIKNQMSAGN